MSKEAEKFDLKLYLDTKFKENTDAHLALKERADKTNGRVRSLEKWRWAMGGGLAVVAVMVSIFGLILKVYAK